MGQLFVPPSSSAPQQRYHPPKPSTVYSLRNGISLYISLFMCLFVSTTTIGEIVLYPILFSHMHLKHIYLANFNGDIKVVRFVMMNDLYASNCNAPIYPQIKALLREIG